MSHYPPCAELDAAKLTFGAEITSIKTAISGLKDQQHESNRNTLLAVASIAFVGVLVTALVGYWGQKMAITAGASQAKVGAAQTVQNASPATGEIYLNGYKDGATIEGAKIRDTLLAQIPIVKSPDLVAPKKKTR